MIEIRRTHTHVEDIFHEFGPVAATPLRRGFIAAVLTNPFAGRFEPNILPMMEALNAVGTQMANQLLAAMAVDRAAIESYGKGAIVGAAGEHEHALRGPRVGVGLGVGQAVDQQQRGDHEGKTRRRAGRDDEELAPLHVVDRTSGAADRMFAAGHVQQVEILAGLDQRIDFFVDVCP